MDKETVYLKKKILKSLRTHLAKRVIFSIGFNGVKLPSVESNQNENNIDHVIMSISHNSKIDIKNANNLIDHIKEVRTFKDYNCIVELNKDGVDIIYDVMKNNRFRLHIFKSLHFADEKVIGYETINGLQFAWVNIIDYSKHPVTVLEEYTKIYHNIVSRLVLVGEKVDDEVDWTSLIEMEKFDHAAN